jgi:hypothetical protein
MRIFDMERTKDFYHYMLAYALVEIRALEDSEGLDAARRLADLFHNVPEALCLEWMPEREERVHTYLQEKAKVHGLTPLLERWERRILRRMAEPLPQ